MSKQRGETLDLLRAAYDELTKAGRNSLVKAFAFGNVVNALHGIFTYTQLAEELGVTPGVPSLYAKLYRKYDGNVSLLLHTAAEMGTYDVSRLSSDSETARYSYVWRCNNCHSLDVKRERQTQEQLDERVAAAVASVAGR
jgi:hypothetical protein